MTGSIEVGTRLVQVLEKYRKRPTLIYNAGPGALTISDSTSPIGLPLPMGVALTWDKENEAWMKSASTSIVIVQEMNGTYQGVDEPSPFEGWETVDVDVSLFIAPADSALHPFPTPVTINVPSSSAVYQAVFSISIVQSDTALGKAEEYIAKFLLDNSGATVPNYTTITVPLGTQALANVTGYTLITGLTPGTHSVNGGIICQLMSPPHSFYIVSGNFSLLRVR